MPEQDDLATVIVTVRSQRVILAADLAAAYGVPTRVLTQAVKRNQDRFPADFAFQLTLGETRAAYDTDGPALSALRSQPVISKGRGGRRHPPLAFTEHGAVAAAFVLNSPKAIEMSVFVVRAFLRLRQLVASQADLARKLDELERRVSDHDADLEEIVRAIRLLVSPPEPPKPRIGFRAERE